jgi:8-amino-3,8-dideoxy-alpha-D-manno-octulosonate transaminase
MSKNKKTIQNEKCLFPSKLLGASLIGEEELKELEDVVSQKSPFRFYGIGDPRKVREFEKMVNSYFSVKYSLAVSSGSAALFCATAALGVGPGDEVIMPAFSWYSDFNSIAAMGALPVFADIDESLNLDPKDFEKKITSSTKAVIVIHYQGGPAKMDEILAIARKHNIKVIEDCAQAFGGQYKGKFLGTMGDIAIASFQNNKIITCGEGGILYTNNEEYFVRAVRYHDLGFVRPAFSEQIENKELAAEDISFVGSQFRMSELQGAFILAQFRKLPKLLEECRKKHRKLREFIENSKFLSVRPHFEGDCGITLFIKLPSKEEADNFSKLLEDGGVPVGPTSFCTNIAGKYPVSTKKMVHDDIPPFGKGFAGEKITYAPVDDCPNTNPIADSYVAIGIGPLYTDENIDYIIKVIGEAEKKIFG